MSISSLDLTSASKFHFNYEISSSSVLIPKLLDKLTFSLFNFENDASDVFLAIFEEDADCLAGQLLLTASQLAEHLQGIDIERCHKLADKLGSKVTDWEARWYNAVYTFKLTGAREACHILMDLVVQYPFDLLAVFFGMFWAFYNVDKYMMRDIIGRVLPFHDKSHPFRNLLDSYYGFSLMETMSFDRGFKLVANAFENDPTHPWNIHAQCHALEYSGRSNEALAMLLDAKNAYQKSSLSTHIDWHVAYLQAELGDFESSMKTLKSSVLEKSDSAARFSDACSLLWILKFSEGVHVDNLEFTRLLAKVNDKITDHGNAHFAVQFAAALIGAGDYSGYNAFRHSISLFVSTHKHHDVVKLYESFGLNCMDSITAFSLDDYTLATSRIYDVRDRISCLGGSQTQKEFYHRLMCTSMLKMENIEIDKRVFCLLSERSGYSELPPSFQRMYDSLSNKLNVKGAL